MAIDRLTPSALQRLQAQAQEFEAIARAMRTLANDAPNLSLVEFQRRTDEIRAMFMKGMMREIGRN